ncbi:MAG: hypothetical protein EOP10_09480 [Proteobacteria bacterium]|nr:MAG: hypothetical protein EOP10_09480 [Pseudomonadota bacterium]
MSTIHGFIYYRPLCLIFEEAGCPYEIHSQCDGEAKAFVTIAEALDSEIFRERLAMKCAAAKYRLSHSGRYITVYFNGMECKRFPHINKF